METILSQYTPFELFQWACYFIGLMAVVSIALIASKVWKDD